MKAWKEYQEQHQERFLNELLDLLRIPSVSAKSEHKPDMQACAEAVKAKLEEAGADKVTIYPTKGKPIVYGAKVTSPDRPTGLVYGRKDVQPGGPVELWKSPPFDDDIREGKSYAKGACGDKEQFCMDVNAQGIMSETSTHATNIK